MRAVGVNTATTLYGLVVVRNDETARGTASIALEASHAAKP